MNFILFSDIGESTINKGLGSAEYSYYFVLKAFRDALIELGTVTVVHHPETEVDPLFEECQQRGVECVFLSFSPPNKTLVDLKCPTISVFAWEYSNIPNELWDEDLRNDWRNVFARHGRTIALSNYTVRAVKEVMGQAFPALAIPTPLWERFADAREHLGHASPGAASEFRLRGTILDSRELNLSADRPFVPAPPPEVPVDEITTPIAIEAQAPDEPAVEIALATEAVPLEEASPPIDEELHLEPDLPASDVPLGVPDIPIEEPPAPPPPTSVPPKNLRYRIGATKRHFLNWYRDVVRDAIPLWLAKLIAMCGHQCFALVRFVLTLGRSPVKPQPAMAMAAVEVAPEPVIVEEPPVEIVEHVAEPEPVVAPETVAQIEEILPEPEVTLKLTGVVYTSVFSPTDGRKNWFDMVTAFCWTFRDVEDATLVLKMNSRNLHSYQATLMTLLSQLSPFKCRVIVLHAFLDDATYEHLIGATTFCVNTSVCEGLCLPLLEFMSCGKPVIAPNHTAMADYVDESVAFVIKSSREHNVWPQDPRALFRTLRYRLNWTSICAAYRESYDMARNAPEKYMQMSGRVLERMQAYASVAVVKQQLQDFFRETGHSEKIDS
jgi:glycosyltransferase involved in cell wall biosynthesis